MPRIGHKLRAFFRWTGEDKRASRTDRARRHPGASRSNEIAKLGRSPPTAGRHAAPLRGVGGGSEPEEVAEFDEEELGGAVGGAGLVEDGRSGGGFVEAEIIEAV